MTTYSTHVFTGDPLDRVDAARRDPKWVESQLHDPTAKFLPFWNMKVLTTDGPQPSLAWQGREVLALMARDTPPVLLGLVEDIPYFAVDVSGSETAPTTHSGTSVSYVEPRHIATLLPMPQSGILAHAKSAVDWHARHGFCANCGAGTRSHLGGKERICDQCDAHHFPRTDPVAIMLVHRGDLCLLGRSSRRGTGTYSALAGFIDQGESIEEAVRREVREEANIEVGEVHYHSSQPWPYPSSLMIGCIAQALSTTIEIDAEELDDVRWFDRKTVQGALRRLNDPNASLRLPSPIAIAHHLLKSWVDDS